MAAPVAAALASVLPIGLTGLDVRETLHRFDANAHQPSLERGVSVANRVGEPIATLTMRWRLAPDGFDATPGGTPPDTRIDAGTSQRFVLQDGAITFEERGRGKLRFFGAGRTYPATTDGKARLLLAGTAVIVEGTGSLKGVRGTLMISGEITPPSGLSLNIVGHFDAGDAIGVEDSLGPLLDVTADSGATVITLVGESDAHGTEHVRVARVGNDLANASRLRSVLRVGDRVGTVRGPLAFDSTDHRCAVPLARASRVLCFTDAYGRPVGTITASVLEGTAFREMRDGQVVSRVVAYGAASAGSGALAAAGGVLTFEAAVDAAGHTTTLYALRLADPAGRFRASYSDAIRVTPRAVEGAPRPAPLETLKFVEDGGLMTDEDRKIVQHADQTMLDGADLLKWWEGKDRTGDFAERFDVVREFSAGNHSYSFFDTAPVASAGVPVMGIVQEMFYDRPKAAAGGAVRDQLREFVMRYFLRTSHVRQPDAVPEGGRGPRSTVENMISWLPDEGERRAGMRYQQLYYKLRESGRIGKFSREERRAIVDLREMGTTYDWVVLKVDIFNFNLAFAPFGADAPQMQMPLKESAYLILGPPFIRNTDAPEPGVAARYGLCYAFMPCVPPDGPPVVAYGPGHFAAAIQTFDFTLKTDGEIRVLAAFVVSRPGKIAAIDIAPVDWGFGLADKVTFGTASKVLSPLKAMADRLPLRVNDVDPIGSFIWAANAMTGGMAGRRLGISKLSLEKRMLLQHFFQHYEMLNTSLLAWRLVPDWTDHENLPAFCHEGVTV